MPLSTYQELRDSILSWLARPGDPLVSPSIPDIIQLFEHEATRRLKVGGAEKRVSLTALGAAVALPADFGELRLATSGGVILTYVTPMQLPDGGGPPSHYTIIGNEMRLGPAPSATCTIEIVYQSGVPPLSDTNTSNWLLTAHPDCYLFGSLVEAESFIGSDERIPLWAQRREAAFASIETADRKARWGGAPLSIRAEGVSGGNGTAAGDWTSAPPISIPTLSAGVGITLTPSPIVDSGSVALTVPVSVANGGTGGTTAAAARASLGVVAQAGDTMTGNLVVAPAAGVAQLGMNAVAGSADQLIGYRASAPRWDILLGDGTAESGGNTGGDFRIGRYNDAGAFNATAMAFSRSSGNATFGGALAVGANTNPTLSIFASNYTGLMAPDAAAGGAGIYVGNAANAFSFYRQTDHQFQDRAAGTTFCKFSATGTSNISGAWIVISDASLKEDEVAPYTTGLAEVVALNPVQFRYRAGVWGEEASQPLFGLMADEVKPHVPEIVGSTTATVADKSVEVDTLSPGLLVFALINAVKELTARVAALEGKPAA